MKNCLPLLIISLFTLIACKKSSSPAAPYAVTATVNGVNVNFSQYITVDTTSNPGTIYIVAHADTFNFTPLLEITLVTTDSTPLKSNTSWTYSYYNGTGNGILGYTSWSPGDSAIQYSSITDTIKLTSVTRTTLTGTFQGTCQYFLDSTAIITNGKFNVPISQ